MIDHCGHVNTRTGRELQSLAKKLKAIEPYLSETYVHAKVAVILDFDTIVRRGDPLLGSRKRMNCYVNEVEYYYRYFNERNIAVDILSRRSRSERLFARVVRRRCTCCRRASGREDYGAMCRLAAASSRRYYSGMADLNDCLYPGGYPGILKDVSGLN